MVVPRFDHTVAVERRIELDLSEPGFQNHPRQRPLTRLECRHHRAVERNGQARHRNRKHPERNQNFKKREG